MGIGYNPSIVTDGLVLCLDAANPKSYPGTGNQFKSMIPNSNWWSITNAIFNSEGYFTFNGTDSRIESTGNINSFNPDTQLTTIVVWFRPTATPANNSPVFSDSWGPEYGIWYNNSNQIQYAAYGSSFKAHTVNTWCCATLMVDVQGGTTYRTCFYNDELVARNIGSGTGNGLNDTPFRLGYDVNTGVSLFQGDIAALMLYNRHLTDSEVVRNFQAFRGRFGI